MAKRGDERIAFFVWDIDDNLIEFEVQFHVVLKN